MYHQGVGAPENREEAIKWYKKASEHGNQKAKESLKLMGVDLSK
jgi:TPR repeat protein